MNPPIRVVISLNCYRSMRTPVSIREGGLYRVSAEGLDAAGNPGEHQQGGRPAMRALLEQIATDLLPNSVALGGTRRDQAAYLAQIVQTIQRTVLRPGTGRP